MKLYIIIVVVAFFVGFFFQRRAREIFMAFGQSTNGDMTNNRAYVLYFFYSHVCYHICVFLIVFGIIFNFGRLGYFFDTLKLLILIVSIFVLSSIFGLKSRVKFMESALSKGGKKKMEENILFFLIGSRICYYICIFFIVGEFILILGRLFNGFF